MSYLNHVGTFANQIMTLLVGLPMLVPILEGLYSMGVSTNDDWPNPDSLSKV